MFQVPKLECLIAKYRSCLKRLILWIKKKWSSIFVTCMSANLLFSLSRANIHNLIFSHWGFRSNVIFLKSCSKKEILLYQCKSITANQFPRLYMSSSDRVFQWSLTCFVARINKWLEKNLWSSAQLSLILAHESIDPTLWLVQTHWKTLILIRKDQQVIKLKMQHILPVMVD
jgi:hypothetical protein